MHFRVPIAVGARLEATALREESKWELTIYHLTPQSSKFDSWCAYAKQHIFDSGSGAQRACINWRMILYQMTEDVCRALYETQCDIGHIKKEEVWRWQQTTTPVPLPPLPFWFIFFLKIANESYILELHPSFLYSYIRGFVGITGNLYQLGSAIFKYID